MYNCYLNYFIGIYDVLNSNAAPSQNIPRRQHDKIVDPHISTERTNRLLNRSELPTEISSNVLEATDTIDEDCNQYISSETQTLSNYSMASKSSQTVETLHRVWESIQYAALKETDFIYYTGMGSDRFSMLFGLLDVKFSSFDKHLSRKDQLVLTLMKYRQNLQFQLIGKLYGIHRIVVRQIFVYYTKIIYAHLNNVDFWSLKYSSPNTYTAIIDCSEIVTNQSTKIQSKIRFFSPTTKTGTH